ncbi:MAG: carbohydrate kinase family protein, partial [bacterium]
MKAENKPWIVSIGDVAWDLFLEIPQGIVWGSDVPGKVEFSYGGSAANFAVWASRMGARVRLLGKVGKDFWGQLMLRHLKKEKVDFPLKPIAGGRTARIGILVSSEGERAMVMDKDPQLAFSLNDFSPAFLEECSLLFFTGYAVFARSSLEFLRVILDYCHKIQIPVAFDPSSFHLMESFGPQ